jgi:hypothetical protein
VSFYAGPLDTLIDTTGVYQCALAFYGLYPLAMSLVWSITALIFYYRRDRGSSAGPVAPRRLARPGIDSSRPSDRP